MNEKCTYFLIVLAIIMGCQALQSQEIWQGPSITFEKEASVDWRLPENQDRILDNVWITRAHNQGIFNFAIESSYTTNHSPSDTEWALGTTEEITGLIFKSWQETVLDNPPTMILRPMVLHLISADIYIDVKFLSWDQGGGGGGFSYVRSTPMTSDISTVLNSKCLALFPDPVENKIIVSESCNGIFYKIIDMMCRQIVTGVVNDDCIHVTNLSKGVYFLILNNGHVYKFLKN